MRIVLDSNILIRAFSSPGGLAHLLLLKILANPHQLILSNELLAEVTKVLRYPRMRAMHGRDEQAIYDFAAALQQGAEFVSLNQLSVVPIRDRDDIHVLQTAVAGSADVLCTIDRDFYLPPASIFLANCGIPAMTDAQLMQVLRS